MWIHEKKNWTNFIWDVEALTSKLADIRHSQGRLLGRMEGLGFELKREASLSTLTNDIVKSSAIEGENLNPEEVRSSIARKLGINIAGLIPSSRDVEGIVEMMLDATQQFAKPLTKKRMFNWHAALFPTGRSGMYRIKVASWRTKDTDPMQVVSGPIGKEKVHFEAPSADRLKKEMREFLTWFDNGDETDPVIKAGIAHLWFVTIHPFEDGNGRIARAIGDMALARADGTQNRFYSLSSQIEAERKQYYDELEKQQRATPDITDWLSWFLDCLGRAISNAEITLGNVLFKAHLWDIINQKPVNDRQRLIINRMLEDNFQGFMNTSKYAKLAKCSNDTALRDIQELKERGIFLQNSSGGRSTSYRLPNLNELP
ncbi:MAG: Fic family protein [Candidatus Melainabacteria bacterium]|nr:Fic family protein [Candidatus Melainabacteria bacterium]